MIIDRIEVSKFPKKVLNTRIIVCISIKKQKLVRCEIAVFSVAS